MPLVDPTRTVRIDLPTPGEWVEVREQLAQGDLARVQQRYLRRPRLDAAAGTPQGTVEAELDIDAFHFALLEVAIVRWSFAEPVTPENMRRLDVESHEFLVARLNELYAPRGEAQRKNWSAASPTSS